MNVCSQHLKQIVLVRSNRILGMEMSAASTKFDLDQEALALGLPDHSQRSLMAGIPCHVGEQ